MAGVCTVYELGRVDYLAAWQLQERLAGEIGRGERGPCLLLLEHPHTYTFGRQGQAAHLLWDAAELERRGVQVHWVDRGGDVTYHGPGQLVGYPLLPLAPGGLLPGADGRLPQADFVGYLRRLEDALIAALAELGMHARRIPGRTGVWTQAENATLPANGTLPASGTPPANGSLLANASPAPVESLPAKIAAIGVKVDARGVSRHGFALNVAPDMRLWQGIIACGLKDAPVTCLEEQLGPLDIERVRRAVVRGFGEIFKYEMTPGDVPQAF